MPAHEKNPLQAPFRRRIPLELKPEEFALLQREERRFGNKRATLVAGLEALAQLARLEQELEAARAAGAEAEGRASEQERRAAKLEAALAKSKDEAGQAKKSQQGAERKQGQALERAGGEVAAVRAELADAEAVRAELERELEGLEAERFSALRCPRCGTFAPPEEWAARVEQGREFVYHEPCGFQRGSGLTNASIFGVRG